MPQEGGSFVINIALSMIGLDQQQKAIVQTAIPDAQAAVDLISRNMATVNAFVGLVNQVMPHLQKVAPAAQIMADALGRMHAKASFSAAQHDIPGNIRISAGISPAAFSNQGD